MSDVKTEKDVAQELKKTVDAAIDTKADKDALDGYIPREDFDKVFGELKDEAKTLKRDLDSAKNELDKSLKESEVKMKAEIVEEMQAIAKAAPAVSANNDAGVFVDTPLEDGSLVKRASIPLFRKAENVNTAATDIGQRVDSGSAIYGLEQFNPFRMHSSVLAVTGGSIKLPSVDAINFASEATVNTSRTQQGDVQTPITVTIETWTASAQFSRPSLEDINGVREAINNIILQQYSVKQAEDMAAVLKTSANAAAATSIQKVETDAKTADVKASNVQGLLVDVMSATDVAYRTNGVFMVSSAVYGALSKAEVSTGGGLEFDPTSGITRLAGYPIYINSYLDASPTTTTAKTASSIVAYFGDFRRGSALCERTNLTVDEYDQTAPGFNTYFATGRFKSSHWDTKALTALAVFKTV